MTATIDAPSAGPLTVDDPAPLAAALQDIADKLGGARFIGRHGGLVDTNDDGSRWYHDPDDPEIRYQSVTWTLSSTDSSPYLTGWAAGVTAELVAEYWAVLGDLAATVGWPAAVAWLKAESKRQRALAADIGTWHHDVLEALLLGDVQIPDPPEDILGRTLTTGGDRIDVTQETLDAWADGILAFLTDYRLTPVMAEATVCNPLEQYAARVDLGAEFPGHGLGLVDMKTGWLRRTVVPQLAAQRYATEVWLPLGERVPAPRWEFTAALHLRPRWDRGYKLIPTPSGPAEWEWFRRACRLLEARERAGDIYKSPLYPPDFAEDGTVLGIPTVPMVEDSGLRCTGVLKAAGFVWIHELTDWTAGELLSNPRKGTGLKGLGEKGIQALRDLLAAHGLAFADETAPTTKGAA